VSLYLKFFNAKYGIQDLAANTMLQFCTETRTYTIIDLFYENGFLRAIPYQRGSLRCEVGRKVHFEQNISTKVGLLRIYQSDVMLEFNVDMFVSRLSLGSRYHHMSRSKVKFT
jgi:hypothetical protein